VRFNPDAEITRDQAARKLNVTVAVIDAWLARGWLDEDGQRHRLATRKLHGQRLIRAGDILQANADTAANRARSHRRTAFDGGDREGQRLAALYADLPRAG
jgi:hypothetical protein